MADIARKTKRYLLRDNLGENRIGSFRNAPEPRPGCLTKNDTLARLRRPGQNTLRFSRAQARNLPLRNVEQ